MVIKYIKYKNMISNESEIEIDFTRKLNKDMPKELFLEETIKSKGRSKILSEEGILKKIALFGKNASYKTSTLKSVHLILDFVINFKKYVDSFKLTFPDAFAWYQKEKGVIIQPFQSNSLAIFDEYLKYFAKNKKIEELISEYIALFFKNNAFNKNEKIEINLIFYDTENKKDLNFSIELYANYKKSKILLNKKWFDLYNNSNNKILNFNFNFVSFESYNLTETMGYISGSNNLFLGVAMEHLYFKNFNNDMNKLIEFINILDPSIIDMKYKADFKNKKLYILSIEREYNNFKESIFLGQLSTGTKLFIIYTYFILNNNFIIIDELEQSLHLKLVELLIDIAQENGTQLLFSTHSPVIIEKNVKKSELYIMELNSRNELSLKKANKIFRERENFIIKYLSDLVSNISDTDVDDIKSKLFYV